MQIKLNYATIDLNYVKDEELPSIIETVQEEIKIREKSKKRRKEIETLVNSLFDTIEKLAELDKNGGCVVTDSNSLTWKELENNIFENYYF